MGYYMLIRCGQYVYDRVLELKEKGTYPEDLVVELDLDIKSNNYILYKASEEELDLKYIENEGMVV